MKLPQGRNTDIVVQEAGSELLIYDLLTNKACNLNETSALIFNRCDGKTTFSELKLKYKHLTDDLIYLTLDELNKHNLIEDYQERFERLSRREVIRKVGFTTMATLPMITSLIAPSALHAQSAAPCLTRGNTAFATTGPGTFLSGISPNDCFPTATSKCCSGNRLSNIGACSPPCSPSGCAGCSCSVECA